MNFCQDLSNFLDTICWSQPSGTCQRHKTRKKVYGRRIGGSYSYGNHKMIITHPHDPTQFISLCTWLDNLLHHSPCRNVITAPRLHQRRQRLHQRRFLFTRLIYELSAHWWVERLRQHLCVCARDAFVTVQNGRENKKSIYVIKKKKTILEVPLQL